MSESSHRPPSSTYTTHERIPFWRDGRVLGVLAQILFVIVVGSVIYWFISNVAANLSRLGDSQFVCLYGTTEQWSYRCAFDFLSSEAQFDISESVIPYRTSDSYWQAIRVGLLNTVKVSFVGIILATILGTVAGIARLSQNWLVRNIAKTYIDIIRNTPLLLQLFFLYFVVLLLELPAVNAALQPFGLPVFISQRGVNFPKVVTLSSFAIWFAFIVLALIQAQFLWMYLGAREEKTGKTSSRLFWCVLSFFIVVGLGWLVASSTVHNEGFLVARAARVREFSDLESLMERRLRLDNIRLLDEYVERGRLSAEEISASALLVCSVQDSPSEVNLTVQLRAAGIPYKVNRFARPDQAVDAYAEEATCDIFVAPKATLAAERNLLEDSANHMIVPVRETPARWAVPALEGFNFVGGSRMSLEFTALLVGLVVYTAAFIAEIVRAGILSVGKGQSEAARALGLSEGQRLRLIVLPQALRVIIPPLTSQYLNLTKNSSLALAVAYPDLWRVMSIIGNQSGRSIQPIILTALTYLTFSIVISLFLNWYNKRIQLVER
ncbi:MAG: ABC transporter permease subunit [Chloroflexi bacterium]|nr:ABC transporter permease subunit [Ardenticatenaceae bacterium]MBL1131260.1 ABC transporter permease subunit [Chloroflexota bacterium]NOG37360.1 ABC transporter permease subunit [Chloroflexota bacterium]